MLSIKKLFAQIVLSADEDLSWSNKLYYILISITKLAPIAFIFDGLKLWFNDNRMFFSFILYAIVANMIAGVWRHNKENSISWEKFFAKNMQMWIIILLTYPLLEMLKILAGDNIISEVFTIVIQVSTILYPGSKLLKNIYIISNRQFPPKFIMERLFKFEKTGNPDVIFSKDGVELTEDEREELEEKLNNK